MRDGVEYRNAPSLAGKRFDCTGVDTSPSSRTPSILVRMCPFPDCHLAFAWCHDVAYFRALHVQGSSTSFSSSPLLPRNALAWVGPPLPTQPVPRIPTYPAPLFASTNRTFSFSSSSSSSSSLSPSPHSLPLPPPLVLPFPTLPSFRLSSSVRKYLQSLAFPYATFLVLSVFFTPDCNTLSIRWNTSLLFMGKNLWEDWALKLNFNLGNIGQWRLFDRYLSFHREQAPAFIERYYCWSVPSLPHSVIVHTRF